MTSWRDVVFILALFLTCAVLSWHLPLDCEPHCAEVSE
jgi:hypothetical protein